MKGIWIVAIIDVAICVTTSIAVYVTQNLWALFGLLAIGLVNYSEKNKCPKCGYDFKEEDDDE